jgi:hypothetical protein
MTAVTSPSDVAHPFTVADLEGMPDDLVRGLRP